MGAPGRQAQRARACSWQLQLAEELLLLLLLLQALLALLVLPQQSGS